MNDALYDALDAKTRRRYDLNMQRQIEKEKQERQRCLHENDVWDYNVRIASVYLAIICFVCFLLFYFMTRDIRHFVAALCVPWLIAFMGLFFTMY